MPALLTYADPKVQTTTANSGLAMHTWWRLTGTTDAYVGDVDNTDGYKIVASFIWRDLKAQTHSMTGATAAQAVTKGQVAVTGVCVETLDNDGNKLAAGTIDEGNFAICHWFYLWGQGIDQATGTGVSPNPTAWTVNGVKNVNWGETRYYTAYEWGNLGSGINGSNIATSGKAISSDQGFELSHATLAAYQDGAIYTQSWMQPKFSESGYVANSLRRYNGGSFGTRPDKVKAYSVGIRLLSHTAFEAITAATEAGADGTVTLSGAATLVASLSFGIASLAF